MAYEPTNWKTGDVVTSAKLNKLENAVTNSGVNILTVTDIPGTMQAGLTAQDFVGAWIFNQSDNYYEAVTAVNVTDDLPFISMFANDQSLFYYPDNGSISAKPPAAPGE